MRRRAFLAGAVGGTGLLTAGVGSVSADGWWGGDPGTDGDSDGTGGEVTSADLEIVDPGEARNEYGAEITCDGTTVEIDGVVQITTGCQGPVLESTTFDGETLTVSVAIDQVRAPGDGNSCGALLTPSNYVATIATDSPPETVVVEHNEGRPPETFRYECGTGSGGGSDGETADGSGGDTDGGSTDGIGWTGGSGDTDGGSGGGTGWW